MGTRRPSSNLISAVLVGLLGGGNLGAEVFSVGDLSAGVYDTVPGNMIPDGAATSITNFHVDPYSKGLIQRGGSSKKNSSQLSGSGAVDVFTYVQQDGDEYIIAFASKTINYSSDNGASFTTLITTGVDAAYWDCAGFVDDRFYCVTQSTSAFRFDGTTHFVTTQTPAGKFIESYENRLWVANTAANPGRLFFSNLLLPSNYTTSTDYIDFDEPITGLGVINGGLSVYGDNNVWVLRGDDPTNYNVDKISRGIGCANNRTIKNMMLKGEEVQVFLSKGYGQSKNNFYANTGIQVIPIGDNYLTTLAGINIGNSSARSKSWDVTADFNNGTVGSGMTTSEVADGVRFSTNGVLLDDFVDGNFTSNPTWSLNVSSYPLTAAITGGMLDYSIASASGPVNSMTMYGTTIAINGSGYVIFDYSPASYPTPFSNAYMLEVVFSTASPGSAPSGLGVGYISTHSFSNGTRFYDVNSGVNTTPWAGSDLSDTNLFNTGGTYTIKQTYDTTGLVSIYRNGVLDGSNASGISGLNFTSIHFGVPVLVASLQTQSARFDNVRISTTAGTYTSEVYQVDSSFTQWGTFEVEESLDGGVVNYYVRTAATSGAVSAATWVSITDGIIISTTTDKFVQWKAEFSRTDPISQDPEVQKVTINWTSSSGASQQPDAEVFKENYWMTYPGSSESRDQSILVINKDGAMYNLEYGTSSQNGFYGLTTSRGLLFAGDSSTSTTGGYVWQLETGNLDDGQAITASVRFKDQEFSTANLDDYEKSLVAVYINYGVQTSGSFTATVYKNFSEGSSSYSVPLASGTTVNRYKIEPNQQTTGRQIALQFSNSTSGQSLNLYPPITYHFEKVRLIRQQR